MSIRSRPLFLAASAAIIAAAVVGGCALFKPARTSDNKADTAYLTVKGDTVKLVRFDTRLRQRLGVGQGDSSELGCIRCNNLQMGMPVNEVTYIIPRSTNALELAHQVWNDEWYSGPPPFDAQDGKRLTLDLDYNQAADPICTGFQSPCYTRSTCRETGYCSQNQTGLCKPACVR